MGDQFVLGRTIEEALARAPATSTRATCCSFDMLGEGARTAAGRRRAIERYMAAIDAIGKRGGPVAAMHVDALMAAPAMSVKLSALHPRYEPGKERAPRRELDAAARSAWRAPRARADCRLTIDAEEQDRLDLTLQLVRRALHAIRRSTAGAAWASPCRPTGSAPFPCCAGCGVCRAHRQAHPGAPGQGRLLGQRDQVGAGARRSPTTRCSRASPTPTSPIWPARACC